MYITPEYTKVVVRCMLHKRVTVSTYHYDDYQSKSTILKYLSWKFHFYDNTYQSRVCILNNESNDTLCYAQKKVIYSS